MRALVSGLGYFVWLVVPFVIYCGYQLFGLPHVIWSYEYETTSRSRMDFEGRWYNACTFVGPYGAITVLADHGHCGWIAFFHEREAVQ